MKENKVEPSVDDNYAIGASAQNGHTEVVKLLLADHRVNPNGRDNFAITASYKNGHIEIVNLLLTDPRVDPSDWNNTAMGNAASGHAITVAKLLLQDKRVRLDPDNRVLKSLINYNYDKAVELVKLINETPVDSKEYDTHVLQVAVHPS